MLRGNIMQRLKNNEKGFGTIEIILVLIIVLLIGAVGYLVYKNQHKATVTKVVTITKTSPATNKTSANDPTASWNPYASTVGKFSLKYPSTWVTATKPELCTPGLLLLGANSDNVGKCGSDNFGQLSISSQQQVKTCGLDTGSYNNITQVKVTASGVTGTKTSGTATQSDQILGSLPEGTKSVQYCFNKNGLTYIADYNQISTYPDVLTDFDLMVTKTLKFN